MNLENNNEQHSSAGYEINLEEGLSISAERKKLMSHQRLPDQVWGHCLGFLYFFFPTMPEGEGYALQKT